LPPLIDIIEDDDAVRDSTHALLESYGYEARAHSSAEAFLNHSGEKADCLVIEHHLRGMKGLDLLEHLRAQGDRTPALMVTWRTDHAIAPRVIRAGARLLHKPANPEALVRSIEKARADSK
jgi:two-component system response regulator FixJ